MFLGMKYARCSVGDLSLRFHSQSDILPVRQLLGAYLTPAIILLERCTIKKLSATIGAVHNGTLVYEHQGQEVTATVGTPSWYAWLETATTFTFTGEEGTFTAHKVRAGNRRGGWYWRAYRRHQGRLSNYYLGVSANLTRPRLCDAARRLAARSESASTGRKVSGQRHELQTTTSSDGLTPLLNTKFALPRLPVQHVSRPHLLALLEAGAQRPVTLVSAAAGSGKTTLLAEWAATTTLPVTWLSLEAADNDPARFLSYLLAALARLDERVGTAAQTDRSWYAHDHDRALTGPLNDLEHLLQKDAVVILDDYHLITSDEVHVALHFLLDHLPARLHLIIGTRVDPPLPLARLRASNLLNELRTKELHFVPTEVDAFVRTMGLTLSSEAMSLLQERTEGWIAGIQLLSLVLRGHADATAFLRSAGSTHHFLLDYVSEEILAQQTPEIQRFLLRTCILDRLCGPLCDAITGEPGGQARLEALLRANLFVSALDNTQTWYRYHPLFAEALRTHLHTQEPDLVPELYRRASYWYEQQRMEEEAVEYAFLAGDLSRSAALLEKLIPHLLEQGKILRLSRWLSQLSPSLIAASPMLWVASISTRLLRTGTREDVDQSMKLLVEQLEQQLDAHAQDAGSAWADLQPGLPLVQAIAAFAQGDIERSISFASEISPTLAHPENALNHFIAMGKQALLGAAYGASGDLEAAELHFLEASPSGETRFDHPQHLFAAPGLSELYEAQGQLRKLGQFYDNLIQDLAQRADPPPLLLALMQARYALLLYEWNRLTEAERTAQQSMEMAGRLDRSVPTATIVSLLTLWTQARIALARGDGEKARHLLERAELDVATSQIAEQGKRFLGAIPARLALACGQLEPALRWVETCGLHVNDSLESPLASNGYLDYITLARVLLAQGRDPRSGSLLAQAAFLLDRLHSLIVGQGRLMEIEMLTALTLQAQGKTRRALTTLGSVLAHAEPEGYIRLFADEGPPMAHLLAQVAAYTTASPGYIQRLQTALVPMQNDSRDPVRKASRQPLLDPLSPREQEVLSLLAAGFSNQQIADHMVISLNTAKRHVKHLLAKLVVTNRTQAVVRARQLHML